LAELVEKTFDDPKRALLALKRGELEVVDWVFPGDLPELQEMPDVVTAAYGLPTIHLLMPSKSHPYIANRNFRRALMFATNREQILTEGVLQGNAPAGSRLLSAPFLAPSSEADPKSYGYDADIPPRPWDPRLAFALRLLTENELRAEANRNMKQPPALEPIVLGHPADEVSRIACRALSQQWTAVGIPSKLKEFPPGVMADEKGECHLVYQQAPRLRR
jgi:ABC-type transport system substrate-binding protein